jgi:hypothetical protein
MDLLWDETVAPNYQKKELSQQRGKSRVHTPCTGKPTRSASSIYTNDIVRGNPAVHGKGTRKDFWMINCKTLQYRNWLLHKWPRTPPIPASKAAIQQT